MNCAQCHAPIGELERTHWICDIRADVCDDCFEAHLLTCDKCRIWHEHDQAMLAAWQLGKDYPDLVWTPDDEAGLQLEDRKRRSYQVFEEVGL